TYSQDTPDKNKPLFTGNDLDSSQISVGADPNTGQPLINFGMRGDAISRLSDFTKAHIGGFMTITLDRVVVSSPRINGVLPGTGQISGNFTNSSAQKLATVLRYGALPLALVIASEERIGATLGQDALFKSLIAGIIGLGIVILFML